TVAAGVEDVKRPRSHRATATIAMLAPVVLLLVLLFILPLALVLSRSFTEPDFGLGNFSDLIRSEAARRVLVATFRVAALTTLISLVLGYPFAYWLCTLSPRARRIALFLVLSPLFTAVLARLYAWTFILG